jgi:hypothetical protein
MMTAVVEKPSPRAFAGRGLGEGSFHATKFLNELSVGTTPSPNPLPR